MDLTHGVSRILEHLENDSVEGATMACMRLARLAQDHLNAAIFLRELYPKKEEVARTLYDDTHHLGGEAGKFVFETSFTRWLEIHTLDYPLSSSAGEDMTVLRVAAGEIEPELEQWKATLVDLEPPSGLAPFDAAAFHDSATSERAGIRLRITALNTIKARLKTRCLNYAVRMERQLASQDRNQQLLWSVQNEVNNHFKEHAPDVYAKLQKASVLAASSDAEDAALALTEVRRALQSAADHFHPPGGELIMCSDGKERVLGADKYLNRLNEHLATSLSSRTQRDLAAAELAVLDTFMRRLHDLASKGVHAEVTQAEARQGLVGLFLFLSTITRGTVKDG